MKYLAILLAMCRLLPTSAQQDTIRINYTTLTTAVVTESLAYTGLMAYLSQVWYKDKQRVPFHFYDDSKGYNQIDKCGHAFGAYLESKIGYEWLRLAGVRKEKALLYGGTLGIILQTPIEIFDGLYKGWGFSWSDMAANTMGSLLLMGQEYFFDDQLLDFKFSFSPSKYWQDSHGLLGSNVGETLFYDYNAHTYWISFLPYRKLPKWMNLSIGYSANGMYGEFYNYQTWHGKPLPQVDRYRQFFLSMDIDWTKIPTHSHFLKKLFQVLNHIKLPFPTIEYNSLGQWKLHAYYF